MLSTLSKCSDSLWSYYTSVKMTQDEFGLDLKVPWAQLLLRKRFIGVTETCLGQIGRWTRRATSAHFSSKIILATNEDRAIDLSCRACGAGAWALGLDSRLGPSAFFPTSDHSNRHKNKHCPQSQDAMRIPPGIPHSLLLAMRELC